MKNRECRRKSYVLPLFLSLLAAVFVLGACTTPEKAKANHVARGQALLKDKKFQEAVLEFRSALQIDDKLAEAHWGLANAYEGLQRYQEAFEEMRATASLDPNHLLRRQPEGVVAVVLQDLLRRRGLLRPRGQGGNTEVTGREDGPRHQREQEALPNWQHR